MDFNNNMELFQFVIGITVALLFKFVLIRIIYDKIRISNLSRVDLKYDNIRQIYTALKKGKSPKLREIKKHAANLENRILVYDLLKEFNKIDFFPQELLTIEKSSESYLANWLCTHDDFDHLPSEINYIYKIELTNGFTFIIFNFKTFEPHIYANQGLMIGYVGYRSSKNDIYQEPDIIYSSFENEVLKEDQLQVLSNNSAAHNVI